MTNITRWDPLREMLSMQKRLDRFFDEAVSNRPAVWSRDWDLALDVVENDGEFVVKGSLPGIAPEELEITYTDRVLTIKGEIKEDKEVDEGQYHLRERRYGAFSRSLSLPAPVDEDGIRATYEAGVLTLHLPKSEEARPKRIPVKASDMIIEG